jgi:hypothetical protein
MQMTFVLIIKEEKVLQSMVYGLNDIETCYGMETNVDKTERKRI